MTWASILALLDGDEGDRGAMAAALALAKTFEAGVDGLIVRPDPRDAVRLAVDGMSPAMIESVIDAARSETQRRVARARETFDAACKEAGVAPSDDDAAKGLAARWHEEVAIAADRIAYHGRLSDVVVVGRSTDKASDESDIAIETVLFETGCPLLIAPGESGGLIGGVAMVAWNGRREAARAVSAALPLLARASSVIVIAANAMPATLPGPEALCGYLARHDIKAEARTVEAGAAPVPKFLLERAAEAGAGLMVMGAYGHSRLRELVLGGVTRQVLIDAALPVFMTH
jgi:nucleotide-binding universal stress UspA family protein